MTLDLFAVMLLQGAPFFAIGIWVSRRWLSPATAEKSTIERYRAAAGRIAHRQPFKDDTQAIAAIDDMHEWEKQALAEFMAQGENNARVIEEHRKKSPVTGFRQIHKMVLRTLEIQDLNFTASEVKLKGHESALSFSNSHNVNLTKYLDSQLELEKKLTSALSRYIDAGKIISDAAKGER